VLNGAQGVNEVATGMAAQGLSIYDALRGTFVHREHGTANGAAPAEEQPASQ